ncbi:MAG: ABC transporter ATP-binding protein, partial [Mesorhizobium sp.]
EHGELNQILDSPQHPYTQHLLQDVPHFASGRSTRADGLRDKGANTQPALKVDGLVVRFPLKSSFFSRATGAVHAVDG